MGNSNSTQKKLIFAAISATLCFGIFKIYQLVEKSGSAKSLENTDEPNKQTIEQLQQIEQQKQPKEDIQFINRISKELQNFEQNQTPLSIETIVRIFQSGFEGAEKQYGELSKKNRIDRRAAINDPYKYVLAVTQFNELVEQILIAKQLEICSRFRISASVFESSYLSHMQNQMAQQQIMMVQLQLRQQLIDSIPSKKTMSESDFQQVVTVQMSKLEDVEYFKKYIQHLKQEEHDLTGILVSVLLADTIYQELGFEEEDIMEGLKQNPQQMKSFAQNEAKVVVLMERLMV